MLLHPSAEMEAVRRLVGLGGERLLPAPAVVHRGGSFSFAMTQVELSPGDREGLARAGSLPCG